MSLQEHSILKMEKFATFFFKISFYKRNRTTEEYCCIVFTSSVTFNEGYIKQYFPMILFIMLNKAVLTYESVDEILKCDHSNESY